MLFISYANESSRLDENLPLRSQFYSDHRLNFSTYTCRYCQSVFFDIKSKRISNRHSCDVYIRSECGSCPADVATAARPRTATMVDLIVLSIKLVFMVLDVSYSRVLAQRPTGCCSASMHNMHIYISSFFCSSRHVLGDYSTTQADGAGSSRT